MNEYIIAVFTNRTSTMQFSMLLNKNGVRSTIVETPKAITASCGVSVRFDINSLGRAREVLLRSGIKNFVRFYRVSNFFGRISLMPI